MQVSVQVLMKGARPAVPEDAPPDLVTLMRRCWAQEAPSRPAFSEIKAELRGASALSPSVSLGSLDETAGDAVREAIEAFPEEPGWDAALAEAGRLHYADVGAEDLMGVLEEGAETAA